MRRQFFSSLSSLWVLTSRRDRALPNGSQSRNQTRDGRRPDGRTPTAAYVSGSTVLTAYAKPFKLRFSTNAAPVPTTNPRRPTPPRDGARRFTMRAATRRARGGCRTRKPGQQRRLKRLIRHGRRVHLIRHKRRVHFVHRHERRERLPRIRCSHRFPNRANQLGGDDVRTTPSNRGEGIALGRTSNQKGLVESTRGDLIDEFLE